MTPSIATDFPHNKIQQHPAWIPLADGTRLYAWIWRPDDEAKVPALLEYLPYRLGDWTAPRDAERHPWHAGHGYASVRVDIRGHGNSDGFPAARKVASRRRERSARNCAGCILRSA